MAIRCPLPEFITVLGGQDTLFKNACLSRPELAATRQGAEGGLGSGENPRNRMHFRGRGGERVGEEQGGDRDSREAGDDALRVVRESRHFVSPLIRAAGDPPTQTALHGTCQIVRMAQMRGFWRDRASWRQEGLPDVGNFRQLVGLLSRLLGDRLLRDGEIGERDSAAKGITPNRMQSVLSSGAP